MSRRRSGGSSTITECPLIKKCAAARRLILESNCLGHGTSGSRTIGECSIDTGSDYNIIILSKCSDTSVGTGYYKGHIKATRIRINMRGTLQSR